MEQKLILASASPRRKELIEQMGLSPMIVKSRVEEKVTKDTPSSVVMELSRQKAEDVKLHLVEYLVMQGIEDLSAPQDLEPTKDEIWNPDQALVLGADTVVAVDGKILGKPRTHAEAADMIRALQGRSHEVYTGVTIFGTLKDDQATDHNASMGCSTFYEETKVHVAAMTEEEILAYARTEEPMDKAGAYGIQGSFGRYISGIEGDYYNVVGLPIAHVYQELKKFLQL